MRTCVRIIIRSNRTKHAKRPGRSAQAQSDGPGFPSLESDIWSQSHDACSCVFEFRTQAMDSFGRLCILMHRVVTALA